MNQIRKSAALHVALGVVALVALVMSRIPSLAAYGNILTLICATSGTTAFALAHTYLPAWAQAVINAINPAFLSGNAEVKQ